MFVYENNNVANLEALIIIISKRSIYKRKKPCN